MSCQGSASSNGHEMFLHRSSVPAGYHCMQVTFLVGIIQLLVWALRLSFLLKLLSRSIMSGFTTAVSVIFITANVRPCSRQIALQPPLALRCSQVNCICPYLGHYITQDTTSQGAYSQQRHSKAASCSSSFELVSWADREQTPLTEIEGGNVLMMC